MKKILLACAVGTSVLLLAGCGNTGQIYHPLSPTPQPPSSQPQSGNLDLQAQCAAQAQKTFDDYKNTMASDKTPANSFGQQNNYNKAMDKCFVLISFSSTVGLVGTNDSANTDDLYDAYKNTELASCTHVYPVDNPLKDTATCRIGDVGATYQEFVDFVNQRMETNFK